MSIWGLINIWCIQTTLITTLIYLVQLLVMHAVAEDYTALQSCHAFKALLRLISYITSIDLIHWGKKMLWHSCLNQADGHSCKPINLCIMPEVSLQTHAIPCPCVFGLGFDFSIPLQQKVLVAEPIKHTICCLQSKDCFQILKSAYNLWVKICIKWHTDIRVAYCTLVTQTRKHITVPTNFICRSRWHARKEKNRGEERRDREGGGENILLNSWVIHKYSDFSYIIYLTQEKPEK